VQAETLEKQAGELTNQLAKKLPRQRLQQRESELEQCVRLQKGQLADLATTVVIREVELKKLKSSIDDLQVIQSALRAAAELTGQQDAGDKRILELQGQAQATARTIQARDRSSQHCAMPS
jgi:hypothetical protein